MNIKNTTLALTLSVFSAGIFAHHLDSLVSFLEPNEGRLIDMKSGHISTIAKLEEMGLPLELSQLELLTQSMKHRLEHIHMVHGGGLLRDMGGLEFDVQSAYSNGVYTVYSITEGNVRCSSDDNNKLHLFLHTDEIRYSFTLLTTDKFINIKTIKGQPMCFIPRESIFYINDLKFPTVRKTTTSSDVDTDKAGAPDMKKDGK